MSAWSVLVGNSTLPDDGINTSWLHLNNQSGGGGGGSPYPVYITQANDVEVTTRSSAETTTISSAEVITTTLADLPV